MGCAQGDAYTIPVGVCVCELCVLMHGELHVEMCWSMTSECGRASGMMVSMVCMLALSMALVISMVAFGIFLVYFHLIYT